MEPGILDLCEAALRQIEAMGAVVEPLPPPFPAEKLWSAWVTLRAMLNAGGKRALADRPGEAGADQARDDLGDRAGHGAVGAGGL